MKKFLIISIILFSAFSLFSQPVLPVRAIQKMEKARFERVGAFEVKSPTPNQNSFYVLSYHLNLDLFPEQHYLNGYVIITIRSLKNDMQKIEVDLYHNMTVDSVVYSGNKINFNHTNKIIEISLPSPVAYDQELSFAI